MAGLRTVSLNCHGFNAATVQYIRSSLISVDCILLQETWLSDKTAYHLNDALSAHFICFHTSAMEEKTKFLNLNWWAIRRYCHPS